ncbi:ATP-binding protein [Pseudosulfitobacter sp. DSM 107133]|uniref:sensor histidine kinase n=1 Tax=Pseudosulfitobacter sp. DSM 107133 TaxID=2883100 RepID=UPI0013B3C601|nr:ATP-binding protein [Pseudosulfitobacter sp. DSM 107133]UOA28636.1 Sensor kinase CckA [Pseudosulfitobacter sp. DSM 107133]
MKPITEITRLRALEYSDIPEWLMRLFGIALGSVMLSSYAHQPYAILWISSFATAHLAYYLYLRSRTEAATLTELRIAQVLFLVVLVSFLWAPAWMASQQDRALVLIGAALFGCILVYLIRRDDVCMFSIVGEIVVIWATLTIVLVKVLAEFDSTLAQVGLVVSWMALGGYFAQSLLQTRQMRLAERAAQDSATQGQKLAAIGQMAGGIAHDFNNHLTVITSSLELYEELEDSKERAACLAAAQAASVQAASIVNELLIFARRTPLRLVNLDANAPLQDLDLLARRLVSRQVEMNIHLLPHPTLVRADRRQLVTAILNLVINANDAMPEGGTMDVGVREVTLVSRLNVAGGRVLPAGHYVSFHVRDTGHGIPKNIEESVIEPMFTTKPEGKGTGLGLAMVHSITESFCGGLLIQSGARGTTVSILLPLVKSGAEVGADPLGT